MTTLVVVGAGLSGLCVAAALASHFDDVVICERDRLPSGSKARRGVPQGEQLHNLLGRGQHELGGLFPGVLRELEARSAAVARVSLDTHVFEMGGAMPRRDLDLRIFCVERPVVEHLAREALLAGHPNVEVRETTSVEALVAEDRRVRGVFVREDGCSDAKIIAADLVVDASGPTARGAAWLADLGIGAPPSVTTTPDQWYVSVRLRLVTADADAPFVMCFPSPGGSKGALLSPIGTGDWYLSVNGRSVDPVPADFPGIIEHVGSLADATIYQRIAGARPVGVLHKYRRSVATWHRYDLMDDPLSGLLSVGDAVASLNPLFGQGMSVAAWEAREIGQAFDAWSAGEVDLVRATREAHRRVAEIVEQVWDLGRAVDGDILGDDTSDVDRRASDFVDALHRDADLHRRYVEVWHLLRPVSALTLPSPFMSSDGVTHGHS